MWIYILMTVFCIALLKCLGYWIGLLVMIRWMEMNDMPQPSDSERLAITKWVIFNIIKDFKRV